ncbi:germination protein GerC [Lentibacillus kapialis]|uniref:Germination protein GerC n=1 Tax=Lentibacillus kapialis TaxID=340214 RepID=A0A917V0J7_9BACI|nr:Ger(x)C family spore germination protein [Lentibacillus kapialis]GGK04896.1 germination protein GerC [Lentibacillus kapialis]
MYLKYIVFFVFVTVSLLFNFQMPTKVIDQIQTITVAGYDATDQDMIRETVVSPKYLAEGKVQDFIYTDTAATVYENRVNLNAQATERLLNGKLEVAFYDQVLAEQGIEHFVDYLTRDPSIGGALYLAVVDGSARELIDSVKTSKGRGVFFNDFFDHNIRHGNLPQTNLKQFESSLKNETCDPFLPMLSVKGKKPTLQSIAFFDDDKYVDKLPIRDADVFKLLYENVSDESYQYKSDTYFASIENMESDKDVDFKAKSGDVIINLHIQAVIREFTRKEPTNRLETIEKDIERDIEQKADKLISRFRELKIDPLCIEGVVKSSYRDYQKERFKSVYQEMPIHVNVDVKITGSGTER